MTAALHDAQVLESLADEIESRFPQAVADIVDDDGTRVDIPRMWEIHDPYVEPQPVNLPACIIYPIASSQVPLGGNTGPKDSIIDALICVIHQAQSTEEAALHARWYARVIDLVLKAIHDAQAVSGLYYIQATGVRVDPYGEDLFRRRSGMLSRLLVRTTRGA